MEVRAKEYRERAEEKGGGTPDEELEIWGIREKEVSDIFETDSTYGEVGEARKTSDL